MEDDRFESYHFESADDLLGKLAPIPLLDTESPAPEFLFRGQRDESWPLIPNALRIERGATGTKAVELVDPGAPKHTEVLQVFAEFQLLKSFLEVCDRAIIGLPGDSHEFRSTWMDDEDSGEVRGMYGEPWLWPFQPHLPLLAVAQHHGVPTRLLDWTRTATVAAYFAAADVVDHHETKGNLAIWALNIEMLHLYNQIELIEMPGANSQRLGAQRGLFTMVREKAERGSVIRATSLADALKSEDENPSDRKPLWKLTLPKTQALRLLYLCHLNGVDGSTVYPGLEGAARATIERAGWSRADPETGRSAAQSDPIKVVKVKSRRVRKATPSGAAG